MARAICILTGYFRAFGVVRLRLNVSFQSGWRAVARVFVKAQAWVKGGLNAGLLLLTPVSVLKYRTAGGTRPGGPHLWKAMDKRRLNQTQGTVDAGSLKITKCWNNSVGQATSLKNIDRTGPYGAFFRPTTKKESGCLTISGEFSGLPPGKHGLQVHCFGDVSNDWISAGPLYNPYNKTNGAQEENRYAAGLGVNVNEDGLAKLDVQVSHLHLTGIHSIIGRTLVIHQSEDEPGKSDKEDSIMAGSDGSAVAWGVIGICQSNIPEDYLEEKN